MVQTDKEALLEMGFEPRRVELALKNAGGLQPALEWLEKHQDTSIEDLASQSKGSSLSATRLAGASSSTSTEKRPDDGNNPEDAEPAAGDVKSYRCNDCGKQLRSWQAVQFHAERTEHSNFDESTEEIAPLTEEEKKAKLEELKQRLIEKKKAQSEESVQDAKKNEAIRRKRDQDSERMKEELRKKEQLKEVAARKQEKLDDARAKAKVKADIAATQQARRDAAARVKAEREGRVIEEQQAAPIPPPSAPRPAQAHTEARLRLQFGPAAGRGPLTKTFAADTTLFEVAAAVTEETGVEVKTLTTTFPPRKTYTVQESTDMGLTLKEANLTPSASLMIG